MRPLADRFILGLSILIIIGMFYAPIHMMISYGLSSHMLPYIIAFPVLAMLVGHVFIKVQIPLLSAVGRASLTLASKTYGHLLEQAARYFCRDTAADPFTRIVSISLADGIEVLGIVAGSEAEREIVFVPTAPNPLSGFILRVSPIAVAATKITRDQFLRYSLTAGANPIVDRENST